MASIEAVRRTISEIQEQGFRVLRGHLPSGLVNACREAFWPRLLAHLEGDPTANRGPQRYFLPMPFE